MEKEDSTEVQTKGSSIRLGAGHLPYVNFGVWGDEVQDLDTDGRGQQVRAERVHRAPKL